MSPCLTWCSACLVAVLFCATLEPSQSQNCSAGKTENATVDLQVALSRGIRGADPIHVASWEACINTCCLGQSISGDKKCNLVVFKPQTRGRSPNCYLFHCPTEGACPLKPAAGLVTYRAIKDSEVLKPTSSLNKSSDLMANGSFATPKAGPIDPSGPTISPHWLRPSPTSPTLKMTRTLLGQMQEPADKIHGYSHHPEGEEADPSKSLAPLPTHHTLRSTNTPQNLVLIIQPTVKLPDVTPSNQTRSVATIPPSKTTAASRVTPDYGNTRVATVSLKQSSPAPQPAATSPGTLPPSLFKRVSSAVSHKARLSHEQLSRDSDTPHRALIEKHAPYWGERSVLLAVLLFGVLFLLLAQVVIGRKLLESLRRRRYSRLDYLINGMYANV